MSPRTDVGARSARTLMRAANAYFPRRKLLVAQSPRSRASQRSVTKQLHATVMSLAACSDAFAVRESKCRRD